MECTQPTGTLLVELWLTPAPWAGSSSQVLDPLRVVPGVFFLAARAGVNASQSPPTVRARKRNKVHRLPDPNSLPAEMSPHEEVMANIEHACT